MGHSSLKYFSTIMIDYQAFKTKGQTTKKLKRHK